MELWTILGTALAVLTTISVAVYNYAKGKHSAHKEDFESIMSESRKFRDDIKCEYEIAKKEISKLKEIIKEYEIKITTLNSLLNDALKSKSWIYHYFQKPLETSDIEIAINKYANSEKNGKILLVNDDVTASKEIKTICKKYHIILDTVITGKQAVESLKIKKPNLIIIDLTLPVVDVFDVLNAVHSIPKYADIPMCIINAQYLDPVDRIIIHSKINKYV